VIPEENLRDFTVVDRCLMHCKTTHFDIESLQYRGSRATYKKVSRTGNRVDQTGIFGLG
jgi:hypothetical protein